MEKQNKSNAFVNDNGHIIPKPFGIDYDLVPGKVYTLVHDRDLYTDYLVEDKDFEFPKKYYLNDKDIKFINKTIDTFNKTEKMTTGVLLSGMKGCGKTLMAKKIAKESGLPIVVIDNKMASDDIEPFFAKFTTDVCIIFDEIDKYWNTRYLLGFLDGVKPTCKKMVIATCNDEKEINTYLNDRCSRIRYKKRFGGLTKDSVKGIINDIISDKDKADAAAEYICSNVDTISYDNVIIFGEEIKNNPNDSFDDIIEFLNIAKR
jgi:SpoVK/Ycf46/Vps4 family AAA+-type ATPase